MNTNRLGSFSDFNEGVPNIPVHIGNVKGTDIESLIQNDPEAPTAAFSFGAGDQLIDPETGELILICWMPEETAMSLGVPDKVYIRIAVDKAPVLLLAFLAKDISVIVRALVEILEDRFMHNPYAEYEIAPEPTSALGTIVVFPSKYLFLTV